MGQKDITEKILESNEDVFADIMNVLLFRGKTVVCENDLQEMSEHSFYKTDGQIKELERDVAKRWMKQNIRIACVGIENQTSIDKDMPMRVIGYDGAEYRSQLKGAERYPVVTLVLYFGFEKRWDKPKNLLGCFDVPEELMPFVSDYQMNLFEIAFLEEELIESFQSDFGVVADYFAQKRRNGDYVPSTKKLKHVEEVLQLLNAMTDDERFEETYVNHEEERKVSNMCEVLDRIEKRGMERGMERGEQNVLNIMKKLFESGRMEDARRAASDGAYLKQLMLELNS